MNAIVPNILTAGDYFVDVEVGSQTASGPAFTVLANPPTVTSPKSISPNPQARNMKIAITGTGFIPDRTTVTFNSSNPGGTTRLADVLSDTMLEVLVPDDAESGPLTIRTPNGTCLTERFDVQ